MQDTPCEVGTSPAPAPLPHNDLSLNPLRGPSAMKKVTAEEAMDVTSDNANDTKETNYTKDSHDEINHSDNTHCVDKSLEVQRRPDSEDENEGVTNNNNAVMKCDTQYSCSICDTVLFSSHDFTIHIRSHNSSAMEGFVCRICGKVLSSGSSLDRHVLVHSGERPFRCRVCGQRFTTSGNMHRHLRTHSEQGDGSCDSDASSDSASSPAINLKKRRVSRTASEFNNNIIELSPGAETNAKRRSDSDENNTRKRRCENKNAEKFDCSLCDKTGFLTSNLLETHIEESHPQYKAKCDPCNLIFKNYRVLNLHRYMAHHAEIPSLVTSKQETIGFKDLTFVDFSSEKFPHIARAVCEQSVHHASSLYHRFQCDKCGRAFPCASALGIHRQGCGQEQYASSGESWPLDNDLSSSDNDAPTDLSGSGKRSSWGESKVSESSDDVEDERKRYNFFAGLDLQNKSIIHTPNQDNPPARDQLRRDVYLKTNHTEGKDLADIQSIISVASTGGLLHDLSKSPQPTVLEVTPPDSGSRAGVFDSAVTDEEQQDCFAAEFRKMKLRGEFPCRLCKAVFPNLRALKGHNRVHLSSNGGQSAAPYRCNMCPHFSSDKSALIRHMRTHNGDRPYECGLCHYAFTTKANCERHLRNRHSKMTREDVKKSIIYHPSEDPTNEVDNKPSRDDVKRSLFNEKETLRQVENKEYFKHEKVQQFVKNIVEKKSHVLEVINSPIPPVFTQVQKFSYVHENNISDNGNRKCLDVGTMTYEENESNHSVPTMLDSPIKNDMDGDVPLDLSMDVLDLSKKKSPEFVPQKNAKELVESEDETEPQDLSSKHTFKPEAPTYPLNIETHNRPKQTQNMAKDLEPHSQSPQHSYEREGSAPPNPTTIPKIDLSKFYSTNPHPFYNATSFPPFPTASPLTAVPYPPYFIPPPPPVLFPPNSNHDLNEMKERLQKELIRGLQLTSGGSLVLDQIAMANAAERIQSLHQSLHLAEFNWRMENPKPESNMYSPSLNKESQLPAEVEKEKEIKTQETTQQKLPEKLLPSLPLKPKQDSSSSVKMVIKNGVLIPKQKQRRYRTERPFSCEHCSARFTLRSNMERHIKQQHPQFWSQRQRNSAAVPIRRNHSLTPNPKMTTILNHGQFYPHGVMPPYNMKSEDETSRASSNNDNINNESKLLISAEGKHGISEEVRHAIAQQLKLKHPSSEVSMNEDNDEDLMDEEEEEDLVIDEEVKEDEVSQQRSSRTLEEEITMRKKLAMKEENIDLASVSRLLDNASTQTFRQYFHSDEDQPGGEGSDEDEEGLVAPGSTSEGCNSGSDENKSESENNSSTNNTVVKKKSAYSLAPNRVSCPYCFRKFPWSSSLRRHVLTHTGQKPYKCSFCPLLFTTKSNCDRHLLRKHGGGIPASTTDSAQPTNNETSAGQNATNYTMRNVPERPYKCKNCPSSTFSTLSNLKKHLSTKHHVPGSCKSEGTQSGYESQGSISEEIYIGENEQSKNELEESEVEKRTVTDLRELHPGHSSEPAFRSQPLPPEHVFIPTQPSDLPFKCHLCEGSFAERQEALDHIREMHRAEFELLVTKGALEMGATAEDTQALPEEGGEESLEQLRGKFPDYANRKVMCAFCLRRFWSAEDLRRHMRTHTGERPFSCDICRRRFTLKHSMLRHRKKHSSPHGAVGEEASPGSDDDVTATTNHNNNTILASAKPWTKGRMDEESDLISNLLGIQDKTIVDKMLISKSADDAAKLLGVQK